MKVYLVIEKISSEEIFGRKSESGSFDEIKELRGIFLDEIEANTYKEELEQELGYEDDCGTKFIVEEYDTPSKILVW